MNQEHREDNLIERLQWMVQTNKYPKGEYASRKRAKLPPISEEQMKQAEEVLGFKLPTLLRRLYTEVADGGFGPSYGLLRLWQEKDAHFDSLVQDYVGMRSMTQKDIDECYADRDVKPALWPVCAVTICDWGCNIYSIVDCSRQELPVWHMDSNISFMVEWALESPSLLQWWERWLNEQPPFYPGWEKSIKMRVADVGK